MKKLLILLATLGLIGIYSCDVIDPPYEEGGGGNDLGDPPQRVILLEDYTGIKCPNCPDAAEKAHEFAKEIFPDSIIIMAIHSGDFAEPDAEHTLDLRSQTGDEITQLFNLFTQGRPIFGLGRSDLKGQKFCYEFQAEGFLEELVKETSKVKLDISVDDASTPSNYKFNIDVKFWEDQKETENIVLYLVESGIIGVQNDNGVYLDEYEHNHVLRGSVNGTFGEPLNEYTEELLKRGDSKSFTIDYSFDGSNGWVAENMQIIACIIDTETDYIIQCAEVDLVD